MKRPRLSNTGLRKPSRPYGAISRGWHPIAKVHRTGIMRPCAAKHPCLA